MPIGDVHADQSRAVAIGRPGIEVTRATEGAVAVLDPVALKTPFGQWHVELSLSKQVHLTHWGALDRQPGHLPFRKAILEPTRQVAPRPRDFRETGEYLLFWAQVWHSPLSARLARCPASPRRSLD